MSKRTFANRSSAARVFAVATLAGAATIQAVVPSSGWTVNYTPVVWDGAYNSRVWTITLTEGCNMDTLCTDAANTVCKHAGDELTRYVDFTAELAQRSGITVASATVDSSADTTLTVGTVSVTAAEVTGKDQYGNSVTIAAGKAIQFKLSGGTAQDEFADPIRLVIEATLSDGDVLAKGLLLRING